MSEQRHHELAIHPIEDEDPAELLKRRKIVNRSKLITVIVLVLLAIGAGRSMMIRMSDAKALNAGTAERAKLYVKVTQPRIAGTGQSLALPGTLQGYVQAPIGARASGYLKRWHKDIGSRVQAGELLAEIDTPEIDQQLTQAIAARAQAASSLGLATSTMERWEALRKKDAVSQQELDERRSNDAQARANLAAADANVERLRQLEGFKRVVAPFSGVITRRNVDVGDLIDAGGGSGRALFLLTQTDPLRIYVNVPQTYSQLIKTGQPVIVTQAELRGQTFNGQVARTSASIDAATRTMQIEITLPNRGGTLLPGAFVQVSLPLKSDQSMTLATNTLMFRSEGMRVAVVDAEGGIKLRPIRIGRNYGERVEVLEGVDASDKVVLNPPDSLNDGDKVAIAPDVPAAKGAPADKSAPAGKAREKS
ncbi:MAG: efflux RND transporter periplasmic adaptor subunit [Betaproteobacteria bacterium]|nr:efflux RND transporter periplasmic adaptor subunit [Betaproteobacteria bacterium]